MPRRNVVAAGDPRSVDAGIAMLRAGGNAVDAAVAATFAAFVAEPVLTAPFGGGFATVGGEGIEPVSYDFFSEVSGRGLGPASEQEGLDFRDVSVNFGPTTQVFHVGRGSVAASLLLPGLVRLHRDLGALPLVEIVQPAIELAQNGVVLSDKVGPILKILEPIMRLTPESEALFAPGGMLLGAGDRFVNPDMAELLRSVGTGELDVAREAFLAELGPPAGRLTEADLDAVEVHKSPPLAVTVAGYEFLLTPPPSSGGLLVAFGLKLLERVPTSDWDDDADAMCNLLACMSVTQAARKAMLDRSIADGGEALDGLAERFLADSFVDSWRERFARAVANGPIPDDAPDPTRGSTTHVSVIGAEGLACAITSSNGEGCGHVVLGTGALANNFLGEEDLHPHGFHTLAAGARLSSMMCPTVVLRHGKPVLALGTGGSNRIRTAILQVLVSHLFRKLPIDDSVQAPRIHYEGKALYVEKRGPETAMSASALEAIQKRVPEVVLFDEPNMFFGGVHAAATGGRGAGDMRRGGRVSFI
ncbi:MAG: gamma-glutamyltransferase [Myxococcota bacterium]